MRYISTRGAAQALDFREVTLAGLASDGGLYVPETWPTFSQDEIAALAGLSYVDTAVAVMAPFVGDLLTRDELRELCATAAAAGLRRIAARHDLVGVERRDHAPLVFGDDSFVDLAVPRAHVHRRFGVVVVLAEAEEMPELVREHALHVEFRGLGGRRRRAGGRGDGTIDRNEIAR